MIAIKQFNYGKFDRNPYPTITPDGIFMFPESFLYEYLRFMMILEGGRKQFVTVDRILKQLGKIRANI